MDSTERLEGLFNQVTAQSDRVLHLAKLAEHQADEIARLKAELEQERADAMRVINLHNEAWLELRKAYQYPQPVTMDLPEMARQVIAELAQAREADRWIPTSERLPETDGSYPDCSVDVLVVCEGGQVISKGYVEFSSGRWAKTWSEKLYNVTHWKPLPQPPSEEG
jgi:hypothetical protein